MKLILTLPLTHSGQSKIVWLEAIVLFRLKIISGYTFFFQNYFTVVWQEVDLRTIIHFLTKSANPTDQILFRLGLWFWLWLICLFAYYVLLSEDSSAWALSEGLLGGLLLCHFAEINLDSIDVLNGGICGILLFPEENFWCGLQHYILVN